MRTFRDGEGILIHSMRVALLLLVVKVPKLLVGGLELDGVCSDRGGMSPLPNLFMSLSVKINAKIEKKKVIDQQLRAMDAHVRTRMRPVGGGAWKPRRPSPGLESIEAHVCGRTVDELGG
jgi:hypothetical protein